MWGAAESYSSAEASVSSFSKEYYYVTSLRKGRNEAYAVYNVSRHTSLEELNQGVVSLLDSGMSKRDLGTHSIPKDDEAFAL